MHQQDKQKQTYWVNAIRVCSHEVGGVDAGASGDAHGSEQVDIASLIQWYQNELPRVIEQRNRVSTLEVLMQQATDRVR